MSACEHDKSPTMACGMNENDILGVMVSMEISGRKYDDLRSYFKLSKTQVAWFAIVFQKHGSLETMWKNEPAAATIIASQLRPLLVALYKYSSATIKMQAYILATRDIGEFQKAAEFLMVRRALQELRQGLINDGLLNPGSGGRNTLPYTPRRKTGKEVLEGLLGDAPEHSQPGIFSTILFWVLVLFFIVVIFNEDLSTTITFVLFPLLPSYFAYHLFNKSDEAVKKQMCHEKWKKYVQENSLRWEAELEEELEESKTQVLNEVKAAHKRIENEVKKDMWQGLH